MKKIMLFASALAGLFLAASCQRENLEPQQMAGAVKFTVEAPGAIATKTIADGQNVDVVHYAVYKTNSDETHAIEVPTERPLAQGFVEMSGKKANINFNLLQDQKYTVIFWAQVSQDDETGQNDYYELGDLRAISMKKDAENNIIGNEEARAAFFAWYSFETYEHKDHVVTFKRPFAQLNLCTLNTSTAYVVDMVESEVIVENVPTVFNVVNGVEDVNSYATVTFDMAAVPSDPATITVNNKTYQYAGMNYMFAGDNITLEYNIKTSLNGQSEAVVNNIISDVPLKENYRTNIVGNLLTSKIDYEIIVDANFNIPDELVGEGTVLAKTSEDLVNALKRNEEHLVIDLVGTQTKGMNPVEFEVPVGAWTEKYYFGGDKTRTITINANGNKINFVHENTDWNYIRMVNDNAKWIINDATLTNSGENDGPWNRHDIRFYNAVELNNVTSDKAIALLNDGELNDVTITEETGAYGLWITADGQKVDINGLNITATNGGRGIAIKDQYVDAPACVTLNVENAKFETAEKAAILVTSTKGAVINWSAGNDIKGVAADPINAVWVDEDYAQYDSEVKIEGASKVVEGAVDNVAAANQETLDQALAAAKTAETTVVVNLAEGAYTFPASSLSANVVLNCAEGTVFQGNSKLNIKGATVIGATFSNPSGTAVDQTLNGTFKNCTFEGANALRYSYVGKTCVFENCHFEGDDYAFHFDGTSLNDAEIICRNCTFAGKVAVAGSVSNIEMDKCEILSGSFYNVYCNSTHKECKFNTSVRPLGGVVNYTGCTIKGSALSVSNLKFYEGYDCTLNIDGVAYTYDADGDGLVKNAEGAVVAWHRGILADALAAADADMIIVLLNDIYGDVTVAQKEGVKIVIDGNDKNYDGMITVDGKSATYTTAGLTIKNLTFNASSISGDACIRLGDGTNATRYTCNVAVENCTFAVPGAVGVKSYTGGDKNLKLSGCTATAAAHSLLQVAGVNEVLVEGCTINSKNGMNFNNSVKVTINECNADVKGYAARFGAGSAADTAVETYAITNSTLKSACEDGDAVIILRGTAANSTLTLTNTTLVGATEITNNTNAQVIR